MYPIPASLGLDPWENYQSYGDGGYKKFVYLCRNGTDWYDGSILKADGLTIDRFCTASSFLEMGNVNAAACSFVLTEPPVDIASWAVGDEIEVQIDPDNRSTISTPSADVAKMGIFVIDSITERLGVYTIDCLDRMVYLDVEMDWTGFSTNYPITTVLSNIASQCGITLANSISGFPNATVGWYTNPTMTCRQVVSAIAEVIGANAYMDWDGELRFGWYEPAKDANNQAVLLDESIAVSRYTAPQYYSLNNYAIGSPDEPQTEITNGDEVTYRLIANPLVEGARDYISVDTIADAIKAARYTAVSSDPSYYQFNGGDYTVLPFPYIWPMDILGTSTADIPITHVTYKLNGNMILGSSVEPRVPQANTFTSPQQTIINNMQEATEEINRHFFYANATGAHITTVENDPDSGNNVLIDSSGLYLREDTDVLAEFTNTGATIGKTAETHIDVNADRVEAFDANGTTAYWIVQDLSTGNIVSHQYSDGDVPEFTLFKPSEIISITAGGTPVTNYLFYPESERVLLGQSYPSGTEIIITYKTTSPAPYMEFAYRSQSAEKAPGAVNLSYNGVADGVYSFSTGLESEAQKDCSSAHGRGTVAFAPDQFVVGRYNKYATDPSDGMWRQVFLVGAGVDDSVRDTVFSVDYEGSVNMGDKLLFGPTDAAVPSYIEHIYGNTNGGAIIIRPGAPLIMGGGEYASARYNVGDIPLTGTGSEDAFLGADRAVWIESNANTIANRKTWEFDASGNLTTPSGGLINGVDITRLNNFGTVQTLSPTMTLSSGTAWQNVMSFDLTPGLWFLEFTARFDNNGTGYRGINISTTSGGSAQTYLLQDLQGAINGTLTYCKISATYRTATNVTRYLNAVQNSGSNRTLSMQYKITLLKGE